jgi:hypothetical protein
VQAALSVAANQTLVIEIQTVTEEEGVSHENGSNQSITHSEVSENLARRLRSGRL